MKINAYLNFNGNCKEAIAFYETVFQTKAKVMLFGDLEPDPEYPMTEEMKKQVMHGNMEVCGNQIMFSDLPPEMEFTCGNNISLALVGDDKELLTKWYNGLSQGGKIEMPLGETMWSELYGCLMDKFGIGWQVNYLND